MFKNFLITLIVFLTFTTNVYASESNNLISNENKMVGNENFENCKNTVLSYLSLETPTKKQIEKLVKRIEIDKENNINVYLAFNHIK